MFTILITIVFFMVWLIYACIFGMIDLILLSPLIIAVTPFVIAGVVILIVLLVKRKKKRAAELVSEDGK